MDDGSRDQPFLVDLRAVVDLLGRHIYSHPRVYVRELLQNAADAIAARLGVDGHGGFVRITPAAGPGDPLTIVDDGIGLTADEASRLLSTVGASSKRDVFELREEGYVGQFGIGLLSAFMIAESVVVRSRSASGASAIEWTGHARGSFTLREIDDELPVGTTVTLVARPDDFELTSETVVTELAAAFGEHLPIEIAVTQASGADKMVTSVAPFLPLSNADERGWWAHQFIGAEPLAVLDVSVPESGTFGTVVILPFPRLDAGRPITRLYIRGMLVDPRDESVLPAWATFATAAVDSAKLSPTASRESVVDDHALHATRAHIDRSLKNWLLTTAADDPDAFERFGAIHGVVVKAMCLVDADLAAVALPLLSLETNRGRLPISDILVSTSRVTVAESDADFRQYAAFATDSIVVNGSYIHDADIARLIPLLDEAITVEDARVQDELLRLELPPLPERGSASTLELRASDALADLSCRVLVREMADASIPAVYVADAAELDTIERDRARAGASPLWAEVLTTMESVISDRDVPGWELVGARLCLNWRSAVVRALVGIDDGETFGAAVRLIHVQALLSAHQPLSALERETFGASLVALVLRAAKEHHRNNDDER